MKRTEQMFKKASQRWLLTSLLWIDEDIAKVKQEFQVWVGLRFALKKQQNVGRYPKKVRE